MSAEQTTNVEKDAMSTASGEQVLVFAEEERGVEMVKWEPRRSLYQSTEESPLLMNVRLTQIIPPKFQESREGDEMTKETNGEKDTLPTKENQGFPMLNWEPRKRPRLFWECRDKETISSTEIVFINEFQKRAQQLQLHLKASEEKCAEAVKRGFNELPKSTAVVLFLCDKHKEMPSLVGPGVQCPPDNDFPSCVRCFDSENDKNDVESADKEKD